MYLLVVAAVLPVIFLCWFINKKDQHKEPKGLLAKLFIGGMVSVIPIVIVELIAGIFFSTEDSDLGIVRMFINTFLSVALIEEGFKWIVTKLFGYNSKHFDEIYDIIVYAVFVSLGFACLENILYVVSTALESGVGSGLYVAGLRALLSVPGHACDAIVMGYFLSKAKVASVNNKSLSSRYLFLSVLVPSLLHTTYDALLFISDATENYSYLGFFALLHLGEVIWCFIMVNKVSKMQQSISNNIDNGSIVVAENKVSVDQKSIVKNNSDVNYCPMCGNHVAGANYCSSCGFKLK